MLARLLIGVLGEVAQHQDDLVLDVERGVAVVAEALVIRDDDAVAGEHDRCAGVAVVGERERPHRQLAGHVPAFNAAGRRVREAGRDRRSAVLGSSGELERQSEILFPGSGFAPIFGQLADEVVAREALSVGAGEAAFEAVDASVWTCARVFEVCASAVGTKTINAETAETAERIFLSVFCAFCVRKS